jgi:hypothetical protein
MNMRGNVRVTTEALKVALGLSENAVIIPVFDTDYDILNIHIRSDKAEFINKQQVTFNTVEGSKDETVTIPISYIDRTSEHCTAYLKEDNEN